MNGLNVNINTADDRIIELKDMYVENIQTGTKIKSNENNRSE